MIKKQKNETEAKAKADILKKRSSVRWQKIKKVGMCDVC